MIKNERQYRITKVQASNFARALGDLRDRGAASNDLRFQVQEAALSSQLGDLQQQLLEYESLCANPGVLEAQSIDELPRSLIRARIASGMNHQELAARLGIKEQQIQRYEATEYAGVSLDRIRDICQALGVEVRNELLLPTTPRSLGQVWRKLQAIGVDRKFVERRLVPQALRADLRKPLNQSSDEAIATRLAEAVGRIFNWSVDQFFSDVPLTLDNAILEGVRYKRPDAQASEASSAYTIYAHYIALLVLQCIPATRKIKLESDPVVIYRAISNRKHLVTLSGVLDFVWQCGIPVIPLRDAGAFHGAWWRLDERDVVVVKQRTASNARWTIDILHEYFHAAESGDSQGIVEETDVMSSSVNSPAEQRATDFAVRVALGGREEELAQACVKTAKGKVEWLKTAVPKVADREGVDSALLCNYMAYRLSFQGINWWPTASALQHEADEPWEAAMKMLRSRIDTSKLARPDQELLARAFEE